MRIVATPIRATADTAVVAGAAAARAAIVEKIAVHGRKDSKASAANPARVRISKAAKIAVRVSTADSVAGDGAAAAAAIAGKAAGIVVARAQKASKAAAQFDRSVN